MLSEEKQGFTTLDFFTIVFSFIFIIYISAPIVSHHLESDEIKHAQAEIAQISRSLIEPGAYAQEFLTAARAKNATNRAIASIDQTTGNPPQSVLANVKKQKTEGDLGLDPWGKAYHYLLVANNRGMTTQVVVWSDGPDGKSQTDVRAQAAQTNSFSSVEFQGDDVGSATPLR